MDHTSIAAKVHAIVRPHMPKNSRKYRFRVLTDIPVKNGLGFRSDPVPVLGTVVELNSEFILMKTGRTEFAVVDLSLVSHTPAVGDHIEATAYCRRDFNGGRLDGPREEVRTGIDGNEYRSTCYLLGGWQVELPISKPTCEYVEALKDQLEHLPAPDGHRTIAQLLVDANATDFKTVEPSYEDRHTTCPSIAFTVRTQKFVGRVTISYNAGDDYYQIELTQGDILVSRDVDVGFDDLGDRLYSLIDDGTWRTIHIRTLEKSRTRKAT